MVCVTRCSVSIQADWLFLLSLSLCSSQAENVTNTDGWVVETPPSPSHGVSARMDSTSQVSNVSYRHTRLYGIIKWEPEKYVLDFYKNMQLFVLSHVVWHGVPGEWQHSATWEHEKWSQDSTLLFKISFNQMLPSLFMTDSAASYSSWSSSSLVCAAVIFES